MVKMLNLGRGIYSQSTFIGYIVFPNLVRTILIYKNIYNNTVITLYMTNTVTFWKIFTVFFTSQFTETCQKTLFKCRFRKYIFIVFKLHFLKWLIMRRKKKYWYIWKAKDFHKATYLLNEGEGEILSNTGNTMHP